MPAGKLGRVLHARHRPEETLLYQVVEQHYPAFVEQLNSEGRGLPRHVRKEFESYLKCGRLEHGFLRHRCEGCHEERRVALSCKRRGFCPSCAARRMVDSAALLVDEVLPQRPLRQWVLTLPVPLRYLCANDSRALGALLGIAYRAISTYLIKRAGRTCSTACCGAVTMIQRFGGGLNLNIHFHMLFLDGVYTWQAQGNRNAEGEAEAEAEGEEPDERGEAATDKKRDRPLLFKRLPPPDPQQVQGVLERISRRIARWLERRGLLERDMEDSHLTLPEPTDDSALADLQAHSLTYRIALGPHRGWKAFTLKTAAPPEPCASYPVARTASFSLHAGLVVEEHQRQKLEHLCRYIARPPLCLGRLFRAASGSLGYRLKTPWKNGTTDLLFEPLDFLAKLAALVPAARTHLTRYHGVFAPHSALRAHITPAGRGSRPMGPPIPATPASAERHRPLNWAQRLKRIFDIDVSTCERCEAPIRLLSYIGYAPLVQRLLNHWHPATPHPHDPAHWPQGPPHPKRH